MKKILLTLAAVLLAVPAMMAETVNYTTADATDIQGTDVPERPAGTSSESDQGEARHFQPLTSLKFGDFAFSFSTTNTNAQQQPAYYYAMSTSTTAKPTIRLYDKTVMTITAPEGATLTTISFTGSNGKKVNEIQVSEGTLTAADGSALAATTSNIKWTGETNTLSFTFAGTYRITGLEITYSTGSPVLPASEAPTFTPEAQAFQGQLAVTLAGNGDIYYTIDGTQPTAESTKYSAPILLTATTTVKAIAIEEGKRPSPVVSATYTLEVAYNTLAEFMEAGLANTSDMVKYSGKATVVYQGGKYLYLTDGTTPLLAYGTLNYNDYQPGDVITGFAGKMSVYNNLNELNADASTFVAPIEKVAAPEPKTMDVEDITEADQNLYVKLTGMVLSSTEADGKTTYKLTDEKDADIIAYPRFTDVTFPEDDQQYDVYGLVSVYKTDLQFYPIEFISTSGVATVGAAAGQSLYFNFQGQRVANPAAGQFLIKVTDGKASKIVF